MTVEIRELVIKTTLEIAPSLNSHAQVPVAMETLRQEILEKCERLIRDYQTKKRIER